MAIRKIARMGHEVLRRVSEPIADPTAPEIARLAQDLIDTCEDIGGNGIAAPQVYEPVRMLAYRVRKEVARRCEHVGNPLERRHQSGDHTINRREELIGSAACHYRDSMDKYGDTPKSTFRPSDLTGNPSIHRASVPCPAASA